MHRRERRYSRRFRLFPELVLLLLSFPAASARDCAHCPEMVELPAGRFVMGAAPGEEERGNLSAEFRNRSEPQRSVDVKRFSAGRFEVTRGEYRVFAEETARGTDGCFVWRGDAFEMDPARSWRNPGFAQDDAHPVTCVSWEDASAYVKWLSRRTGRSYRLLTEAEWEYAARAGTTTTRFWGDDADKTCDYANGADRSTAALVPGARNWHVANCDDRHAYTAPLGSYRPNAFGLHDMLGNVEEWTQDCWNGDYQDAPSDGSACRRHSSRSRTRAPRSASGARSSCSSGSLCRCSPSRVGCGRIRHRCEIPAHSCEARFALRHSGCAARLHARRRGNRSLSYGPTARASAAAAAA